MGVQAGGEMVGIEVAVAVDTGDVARVCAGIEGGRIRGRVRRSRGLASYRCAS